MYDKSLMKYAWIAKDPFISGAASVKSFDEFYKGNYETGLFFLGLALAYCYFGYKDYLK